MLLTYIFVVVGSGLFSTHYHVVPVVVGTRYIRHCCFIVGTVLVSLHGNICCLGVDIGMAQHQTEI